MTTTMTNATPRAPRRKRFHGRAFVSLLAAMILLVLVVSGAVLYCTPKGRIAHWTGWRLWGLSKDQWAALHISASWVFLIVAVAHVVYNARALWRYVKRRAAGLNRWLELALAVLLTGVVVAATLLPARNGAGLPPFSTVLAWNEHLKGRGPRRGLQPPVPHAEEFSLTRFAEEVGLTPEAVAEALRKEGFAVDDTEVTVGELARRKGVAPSDVYEALRKRHPEIAPRGRGRGGTGRGRGAGGDRGSGNGAGRGQGAGRGVGRGWGRRSRDDT